VQTWSGLRPASPDELPLLGPIPGLDNVFCGTGHFRAGLQMSPGTAAVLTDLLLGRPSAISLDGLTCDRWMTP
jgi:glycine/D-amino acid oxidase-like deaminating enzyme